MERERWLELYQLAKDLGKLHPEGVRYSVAFIVGVFLWSVVHDRPVSWACDRSNWGQELWFRRLPSQSTMSRRLRSPPVQALLAAMEQALRERGKPHWINAVDSKPLVVSPHSKDREATWGRGSKRKFVRGYKLHAMWDGRPLPAAWCIRPMNVHDARGAEALLDRLEGSGYLLGDSQCDSNQLYDLAGARGYQLVAPRQKPGSKGIGHHRHSPFRLRSIELLQTPFGQTLLQQRNEIERCFGSLTCFGGGLAPLPSWVRGHTRVRLWVHAKLLVNAIRITTFRPRLAVA